MKQKILHITPALLSALLRRQQEIDRQQYLLACMQAEMERYLENQTGVDLRKEQWHLDLEQATLSRTGAPS